jgi:hypothetical protein
MKKLILTMFITMFSIGLFAQPIPPPVSHGSTGDQQGAPIDGGLSILMLIGAAYGAKKAYKFKDKGKMIKE